MRSPMPALIQQKRPPSPWPQVLVVLVPALIAILLAARIDFLLAGILYVLVFITVSFWRPEVALMLVFALAPLNQDISFGAPVRFSIGELSLILALPAFIITSAGRIRTAPFMLMVLIYLGFCIFSSIMNNDREALTPMLQMIIYLILAVVVFSSFVKDISRFGMIIDASVVVLTLLALSALLTNFSFLSMHKNAWGASMSSGVIITTELWFATESKKRKRWLAIALAIISAVLVLALSRGAWMAAISGIMVIMYFRRQYKILLRLGLLLIPLIAAMWLFMPEDKRDYATGFDASRQNISARIEIIEYARDRFFSSPVWGVGISLRKNVDATNIVLISLAESGILGFGSFIAMHGVLLATVRKTIRRIPRNHVLYSPVALGAALVIARLAHGCVDHYWSRGPILQAWAAAGMATAVTFVQRKSSAMQLRK